MINKTRIQPKLLLTAITLLTIGLCVSTHAETASLTVTSADGRATFDNGSGAAAITEGATLTPGSIISTAEGGEVTLALGNNIGSLVSKHVPFDLLIQIFISFISLKLLESFFSSQLFNFIDYYSVDLFPFLKLIVELG